MDKSIRVTLEKEQELTSEFMDMFAKFIIHSADTISGLHYEMKDQMRYSQMAEYLSNITRLRHNGLKSPCYKYPQNQRISFNFSCKSNTIVFMLDLSPYMLIYNYGSKSFPLKDMQEIIINLLRTLAKRQKRVKQYHYNVTIYLFSTHRKNIEMVLLNEGIHHQNIEHLCQFINLTIEKSKLPYLADPQRYAITDILQTVFNAEESISGIKSLVVISSFIQLDSSPIMLFTPNWYTFSFINTGGHYGSYKIENQSLHQKLIPGMCFKTKFVFRSKFLQNWEMTDIAKRENPNLTKPITEKFRSIQFEYNDTICPDIFDLILVFRVEFRQELTKKIKSGGESVISGLKEGNRIVMKTYNIPADSFFYVLRTRYIQGWQPVLATNTMAVQNCKFKLRLQIEQDEVLFYEASRIKNHFKIVIYELMKISKGEGKTYANTYDKSDQLNMIEKMDKLISYNFATIANETQKTTHHLYRQNSLSCYLFQQHNHKQILSYLSNVGEWGKFFKLKRICFRFQPQFSQPTLQEFTSQVSFILGKRLMSNIFIKQLQVQTTHSDKIEDVDSIIRKVMLTKINVFGNVLELEVAFLRFPLQEIKSTLSTLRHKIQSQKFKKAVRMVPIPTHVSYFYKNQEIINHYMFNKKWTLKFKSMYYYKLFIIYWESVLRKLKYDELFLNLKDTNHRYYYKVIDVRTEGSTVKQIATFLAVKENLQKNEILFHFAIPPSFLSIHPFHKQCASKPIIIPDLLTMLTAQLKKTQQEVIKLIDTYQTIHHKLLKLIYSSNFKAINETVQESIANLYDIKAYSYPLSFKESCREIIYKYYRQHSKDSLNCVPTPSKLLMATDLDSITGDLNLTIGGRQYAFFLCSPFKFLYLQKREKNLYYKFVNMHYEQFSNRQNQTTFTQVILQEVVYRINQQVYMKDFKIFLEGNFKGGITKIIDNQQFTHLEERDVSIGVLFEHCEKYYLTSIVPGSLEEDRCRATLELFTNKLAAVIEEFFPLKRVNYYFQIRNEDKPVPFNIDTTISRNNTELFMRMYLKKSSGQLVDIDFQTLPSLIIKHFAEICANTTHFQFKFYLKAKNNNQKSLLFINTFTQLIRDLCFEMSFDMERSLLYKVETLTYKLDNFSFLWSNNELTEVRLFFINKECEKIERLCRYIEDPVMQHQFPMVRVRPLHSQYMIFSESKDRKGDIMVKQPFLMRVIKGKLEFICYKSIRFFVSEQTEFKRKLQGKYVPTLNNFINACVLMDELIQTYQLPLGPHELWMNETVNHSSNKFTATNKKMPKKNLAISKFLAKKMPNAPQEPSPSFVGASVKINLTKLYRSYLPLNDRMPPNIILHYLKQNQIFSFSIIHNMRNTYLFQKFYENNHVIFYFQEQQDQSVIQSISEQNKELSFPKCKNYLVYTAFCLNPYLQPKIIDKKILPHLLQVLHKQLFDDVSRFLNNNHDVIQEFEQSFIKRREDEEKKQFKFDLPNLIHKDHVINYIMQNLQIYHYRVSFKSHLDKEKFKAQHSESGHRFLESFRFIQPVRYQMTRSEVTRIQATSVQLSFQRKISETTSQHTSFSQSLTGHKILIDSTPLSNSSFRGSQLMLTENQSQNFFEALDHTWLFNCERPHLWLAQKYGKCLYFLKLKFREEPSKVLEQQCSQIFKANYLFTRPQGNLDFLECVKPFLNRKTSAKSKKDSLLKYSLCYQIPEYVGSLQFNKIESTLAFITKASMAEAHLENYFYRCFTNLMKQFSFLKEKKGSQSKEKQVFYRQKVWPSLLLCNRQFSQILSQFESILFFKYSSNTSLLMKDLYFYFIRFLQEFNDVILEFKKNYTNLEQIHFEILFYGENQQRENIFILGNLSNLAKLKDQIEISMNSNKYIRMGFIASDYISIIRHYLFGSQGKPTKSEANPSAPSANINDFKYFKDCEFKEDFKYKRSIYIYFQITQTQFNYGSYNFKPEADEEIKEYLSAVDCWLIQKAKLFSLIKNIKENNTYEFISSKAENSNKVSDPFYKLRLPQSKQVKQKPIVTLSLYRLLVNVIFKDMPEVIPKKQFKPQSVQQHSSRLKYSHHHIQMAQLLSILEQNVIEYKKYPTYKGNEKFLLEKWGREYVSILRKEYGLNM